MSGKGSWQRPRAKHVTDEQERANWERIFGKAKKKEDRFFGGKEEPPKKDLE